jgi:23S rRNA (adenine2503-C2)-methyltransferase
VGTVKFVTRLPDDHEIESVVIPMFNRHTICVSSQVGCRMGCTICETARMGFIRNLTAEEIVGQVYTARYRLDVPIRNIVFMGMGEPLDNFANVVQAIRILSDPRGFDIARRYITVSTIGNIEGIQKLADLGWPTLKLAISLNAPNDTLRSRILPINRRWPMARLKETLAKYPLKQSSAIMIEYVLIKDVNDSREHARELAEFLRPLNVKINLIPYNHRSDSPYASPREEDVERFCGYLIQQKMFVRKRLTKGRDILAACGQLGASANQATIGATATSQLRQ